MARIFCNLLILFLVVGFLSDITEQQEQTSDIIDNAPEPMFTATTQVYEELLSRPPNFIWCALPFTIYFDPEIVLELSNIADKYNLRLSDVLQVHAIIQLSVPNVPFTVEKVVVDIIAFQIQTELYKKGVQVLPSPQQCYIIASTDQDSSPDTTNSSPDLYAAYNNLLLKLDDTLPYLSAFTTKRIQEAVFNNFYPEYVDQRTAEKLVQQLKSNVRYCVGTSIRYVPKPYYY